MQVKKGTSELEAMFQRSVRDVLGDDPEEPLPETRQPVGELLVLYIVTVAVVVVVIFLVVVIVMVVTKVVVMVVVVLSTRRRLLRWLWWWHLWLSPSLFATQLTMTVR